MNSNFIKFPQSKIFSGYILASFFAAFLTSCGGESSKASTENNLSSPVASEINGEVLAPGTKGQSPVPPSTLELLPQVTVGQRQFADPNVLLNLQGTAVAATGSQIVKTLWTQVSGPQVVIPSPQALNNLIVVPDVSIATNLEFRLTAQDSEDRINSATVSILVKPVPTFVKVIGGVFNEADEQAVFKIRLNAPSTTPITISYLTQDGTANSGSRDEDLDYVATFGDIVFEAGEVLKEIPVTLINDVAEEDDETFSLQVTAIDGSATHANKGVVIIRNGTEPQLSQSIEFSEKGHLSVLIGEEYTNPINPAPLGSGDIMYSSSDSSIATVNAKGVVTGVGAGTVLITATKLADENYLSATASYALQVISRGTPPTVNIFAPERSSADGYSVQMGETLDLWGSASDQEDGELPTQAQIDISEKTDTPITSLTWVSDIDGFLGYGDTLDINWLSQGTHYITYSATDSDGNTGSATVRILVGNIAPFFSSVFAESTYCPDPNDRENCYDATHVYDTSLSDEPSVLESWVNDDSSNTKLPQSVSINWDSLVSIDSVDIYSSNGYVMRDYDIEYLDGESWITLASIVDNTEVHRTHATPTVMTYALRVVAKKGSVKQPQYARINEIVVFGTLSSEFGGGF